MCPDLNESNHPQLSEVEKATKTSICRPSPATLVRGDFEVFPCYFYVFVKLCKYIRLEDEEPPRIQEAGAVVCYSDSKRKSKVPPFTIPNLFLRIHYIFTLKDLR